MFTLQDFAEGGYGFYHEGDGGGAGDAGANPAANPDPNPADDDFDKDRAMTTIRTLREENKTAKAAAKEAETLRAKLSEIEKAQMSEMDRAKTEATEKGQKLTAAEQALRQERVERQIERSARALNIIDEEAAVRLLDHSKIEYDDEGKPTNVDALLKELAAAKTYLVAAASGRQQQSGGSSTNPSRPATGNGTFTTSQIRDRAFYEANLPEIERAYNEGRIVEG